MSGMRIILVTSMKFLLESIRKTGYTFAACICNGSWYICKRLVKWRADHWVKDQDIGKLEGVNKNKLGFNITTVYLC